MRSVNEGYQVESVACSTQASAAGLQAFVDARYGLSMHWGLYALYGRGEWVHYNERIPLPEYRRRLQQFNPVRFCAEEWADLVLESGQKFLLITAKHHDGFCLWPSQLTDFTIAATPFGRDPLAELAAALHARGLGLHFYYSLLDWTHPAYRSDWPAYVAYYQGQLRELLTGYGPIAGVIFDGYWPRTLFDGPDESEWFPPRGPLDLQGTYELIHSLQPDAVVANNGHIPPLPGEDYQVWELDMPGQNTVGFNTTDTGSKPFAVWWNLNQGWSYAPSTHAVKEPGVVLATLRQAFSHQAVFMLNVGPRPFGDIHPEEQQALRRMGTQLRQLRLLTG